MAIENTYLLGKNITLGCGFDLQAKAPLDSRQIVPSTAGLQALIDGNAAYEGMIVYDEESKKTYQAQIVDDVLTFREFGINEAELKDLIASETTAAMEFKGAAIALPENPAKGDMYKVTASFKVGEEDVKVGDSIVYDGEQWFIIPSGDDIEDTWRPVTGVDNDATLTFIAGDKLEKTVAADGTITYKHVAIDTPEDMTSEDDEKTRTYITQLITDNHGHIIGFKTATENVEDTNTEYTFEGQSDEATSVYFQVTSNEEGASAEVIYLDAYSKNEADAELAKKVDKVEGYSLVSDTEIARLADVDNYDDEEIRGLIDDNAKAIDDLETYVGTIPTDEKYADITNVISYVNKKAEETLTAAQGGSSETAASVKQQLDNYKSENDTRVKAAEDAIDAIEADYLTSEDKTELSQAIVGVKATAEAAATKEYADAELAKKVAKTDYEADKATFATKTELGDVDAKFADYKTAVNQKVIDDEQDRRIGVIEGDYLKAADITNFETKENVKKVADDLGAYKTSNDAALAAETKARTDADVGFETRIAALEDNFGDGEGTVEAQIAAAVKVEEDARKEAIQSVRDAVDAIEADYVKSADIADFETKENVKKVSDDLAAYVESNNAAVADRYTKAEADGKFALIADAYNDEEVRGLISDNTDAIAAEKERAEAAEAGLQTQINTIMNNPDAEGAINSINEFTQYVKNHGTIADGMRTDINKNKDDIAALNKGLGDHEALAAETYETKDDASAKLVEAKEYADSINTALDERIDALEAINHDAYTAADAALKAELQAEIDADVKALADGAVATNTANIAANAEAIATKANATDVYTKTETYTKAEIESLLTWGSF